MANPSPASYANSSLFERRPLYFDSSLKRNRLNKLFTSVAGLFASVAVLPLFLVIIYVLIQGGRLISLSIFTELPPPPGLVGGGIGNAILGTILVTLIASLIAIPVGVGGGI